MKKLIYTILLTVTLCSPHFSIKPQNNAFDKLHLRQTSITKLLKSTEEKARAHQLSLFIPTLVYILDTNANHGINIKTYKEIVDTLTVVIFNLYYLDQKCDKKDLTTALTYLHKSIQKKAEEHTVSNAGTDRLTQHPRKALSFLAHNEELVFECCICLEKKDSLAFHKNENVPHFFCTDCMNKNITIKQDKKYMDLLCALVSKNLNVVDSKRYDWQYTDITQNDKCPLCRETIFIKNPKAVFSGEQLNPELYMSSPTF
ncbi:MAG: hypothetical protein H6679_01200 [Epsilonproteobacteria bacterium]|nr:hypothetical protein [Campylobacterota bacterium]